MNWLLKLPRLGGAQYGLKYFTQDEHGEYSLEVYKIHPINLYHFTISLICPSGRRAIKFDSCDESMRGWINPYHAQAEAELQLEHIKSGYAYD